ncbi:MAG: NADH dehydrogenase (quinone) subunit D [Blastocatellia bacterium]|nr:NADH dehydrogenase (quinone) subunit D [Blastocatellia bacterium]MBK6428585.1 NADH dehydrogenase (quinone) subunit D [Blastocatellia bacterium]
MTLSMGPQHPSTHGVLRLELELDGEIVISTKPDIGYLHTGMEKLMEAKKYQSNICITDRMDYLNPMGNNLGYVLAVEKLLQLEIPPRAQCIRVLMCELQRIASHLVWIGTHALDVGAMSVFFYAFDEREKILNMFEDVCGGRMTPSYFRVGGMFQDLPAGFDAKVNRFLSEFPSALEAFDTLLTGNRIFRGRLQGVGVLSAEDAISWGITGPSLRGSGVEHDLRRAEPYSGYENYDFDIPTFPEGDVWARYQVRRQEFRESLKIVRQCIEKMPTGPIKADNDKVVLPDRDDMKTHMDALIHHFLIAADGFKVPEGEVYVAIEGSKGELGYYIISDGSERPFRCHVRGPSFVNLSALPDMVKGSLIADVVAVIGSIDIVLGEIDR